MSDCMGDVAKIMERVMMVLKSVLIGVPVLFLITAGAFGAWNLTNRHYEIHPERYKTEIIVDDSAKIPFAVSNVLDRVLSKGFILTSLKVEKDGLNGNFKVKCYGSELADILSLE